MRRSERGHRIDRFSVVVVNRQTIRAKPTIGRRHACRVRGGTIREGRISTRSGGAVRLASRSLRTRLYSHSRCVLWPDHETATPFATASRAQDVPIARRSLCTRLSERRAVLRPRGWAVADAVSRVPRGARGRPRRRSSSRCDLPEGRSHDLVRAQISRRIWCRGADSSSALFRSRLIRSSGPALQD